MAMNVSKKINMGFKIIGSLILVVLIVYLTKWIVNLVRDVGLEASSAIITLPGFLVGLANILLGLDASGSVLVSALVVHIAVFAILFFALSDIIHGFSAFSEMVSYIIGFGLALILGATGAVGLIGGIFGVTAGIGALGIAIIVLASVFAAVVLHLGVGKSLQKWRLNRQMQIEVHKAMKGSSKAADAIRGLKEIQKSMKEGEKE